MAGRSVSCHNGRAATCKARRVRQTRKLQWDLRAPSFAPGRRAIRLVQETGLSDAVESISVAAAKPEARPPAPAKPSRPRPRRRDTVPVPRMILCRVMVCLDARGRLVPGCVLWWDPRAVRSGVRRARPPVRLVQPDVRPCIRANILAAEPRLSASSKALSQDMRRFPCTSLCSPW